MSRSVAKYALCVQALLTLVDAKRRRRREQSAKTVQKEALRVWEDEGGALP